MVDLVLTEYSQKKMNFWHFISVYSSEAYLEISRAPTMEFFCENS